MDSADKNRDRNTGQEWDGPTFSWEEMQGGIFDKILEEEPGFFEEKPRRRMAIWFWLGAAALLLGGFGIWQFSGLTGASHTGGEKESTPNCPATAPTETQEIKTAPIANIPNDLKDNNLSKNIDGKQASRINTNIIPAENNPAFISEKNSGNINGGLFIVEKNSDETVANKPAQNTEQNTVPTNKSFSEIPSSLFLKIHFLEVETNYPSLALSVKAEAETGPENNGKNNNDGHQKKGQWAVAATGGSVISLSKYAGSSTAEILRNNNTSPYFGYQFGVGISAPLSQKSHLFFGANRAVVYQNIDIQTARQVDVLQKNALLHETRYVVGNRVESVHGDTLVTGTERNRLVKYNAFKSIQIHAGYARDFSNKKWTFSPFGGLAAGMVDHQKGYTVADDKSIFPFDKDNPILQRFQFQALAGVNAERKLSDNISLLFQYRFDQQLNNASAESGLTLRPAYHFCSLGIAMQW